MKHLRNYSIVISFFLLWLSVFIPLSYQFFLGLFFILSFGILHGSNDILLVQKTEILPSSNSFLKVLTIYIFFIILNLIAFYFIPAIILSVFIIFSAYHFGEQHWTNQKFTENHTSNSLFYLVYGSLVLFLLFYFNSKETSMIVYTITGISYDFDPYSIGFYMILILHILWFVYFCFRFKALKKMIWVELLYLMVFAIIFYKTSLIWGFAIYFIVWHSIPSIFDQVLFIYGDLKLKHIKNYLKKAFPYWIISSVGIILLYILFKNSDFFYALFFSFLAAVTFPHSLIINKMFKKKSIKNSI